MCESLLSFWPVYSVLYFVYHQKLSVHYENRQLKLQESAHYTTFSCSENKFLMCTSGERVNQWARPRASQFVPRTERALSKETRGERESEAETETWQRAGARVCVHGSRQLTD